MLAPALAEQSDNVPAEAATQSKGAAGAPKDASSLTAIGEKLANPLSDLWALQMNFQMPQFSDGDVNTGDPKLGANMIFQPVLAIPLFGQGDNEWRMIIRPIVPLIFSQPVPDSFNDFHQRSGIGDMQLPLVVNIPKKISGNWLIGAGPTFMFPSATNRDLGSNQWGLGPAVALGYKGKSWVGVLFPNYFWKVGSSGPDLGKPDISQGTLLYSFTYSLPKAWQVGTNPTITYNNQATAGNKLNVPVGFFVGRTVKVGKTPVNIKLAVEHSVVSEDFFGKRTQFRILITPVIPSLIKNPIFGSLTSK
jgi:hypothetical protein